MAEDIEARVDGHISGHRHHLQFPLRSTIAVKEAAHIEWIDDGKQRFDGAQSNASLALLFGQIEDGDA